MLVLTDLTADLNMLSRRPYRHICRPDVLISVFKMLFNKIIYIYINNIVYLKYIKRNVKRITRDDITHRFSLSSLHASS